MTQYYNGKGKNICNYAIPDISQEPHECGKLSGVQIFLVKVTVEKWPQDHYFSQKVLLVGTPIILFTYYWVFHVWIYFQNKKQKEDSIGNIFHTRCEHWTAELFDVQADHLKRYLFSVGIWPVLKWLILSGTVPSLSYRNN